MQGFGAVGQHGCRFLQERGAIIVAVADSRGGVLNPDGLPLADLLGFKASGRSVHEFPGGRPISAEELIGVDCEIWVPAARPDVLTIGNVSQLRTKVVIQGANIPATLEAEQWMHEHGVLSLPDFIANAGGVICAAVEYGGGTQTQVFAVIDGKIRENTKAMLEGARATGRLPRTVAEEIATGRLREAQGYRR
jgi:glutamate dehydrogenase (NAD(P)+)